MRKIGILTGGGDCPGLNAVIRGVVEKCAEAGIEVFGFRDGWRGAMRAQGRWLTLSEVEGIQTQGGTIIGSSRTNGSICRRGRPVLIIRMCPLSLAA